MESKDASAVFTASPGEGTSLKVPRFCSKRIAPCLGATFGCVDLKAATPAVVSQDFLCVQGLTFTKP